jgi:ligand-binding sensor domain-containing protein
MRGPDGKLWIATEDAGIAIWDQQEHTFTHLLNKPSLNRSRTTSNVHALTTDSIGNVWCGNFFGGINKIAPATLKITNYSRVNGDPTSLTNNFVFSLYNDSTDLLWVGTMGGLDRFDKKTGRFSRFKPDSLIGKFIYDIFQDNTGNFWFCTYSSGIYHYDPRKDVLNHYLKNSTPNLTTNSFISHCVDHRGNV